MRKGIGNTLLCLGSLSYKAQGHSQMGKRSHIAPLLDILICIINGIDKISFENLSIFQNLLLKIIIPLHSSNEMVEWRDQIPVIQEYHSSLIKVIQVLMEKKKDININFNIFNITINELLSMWPIGYDTNTPKELLFLHEIEKIMELAYVDELQNVQKILIDRISKSIGSETDNIRTIQRTLQIFKNEKILNLFKSSDPYTKEYFMIKLVPALYRNGVLNWNQTVNKMTGLALKKLIEIDKDMFMKCAKDINTLNIHIIESNKNDNVDFSTNSIPKRLKSIDTEPSTLKYHHRNNDEKLQLPMKPPINHLFRSPHGNDFKSLSTNAWKSGQGSPPLTITGVAPWSISSQSKSNLSSIGLHSIYPTNEMKRLKEEEILKEKEEIQKEHKNSNGVDIIMDYIDRCLPKSNDGDSNEDSSIKEWNKLQSAPTPTLIPSMKFHDLVFGRQLGSGSFSTVRYARQIIREKSRDNWPEFAVKMIGTSVIIEKNYYLSTIREISILQLLCHPGISRLISSFQYNNAIYLVLEYASKGDLHSYVLKMGPLSHLYTRFILGEVASAIKTIHDLGFSYNDLKPENLIITEQCHIKVADFGACRPIRSDASKILEESRNLLIDLRDGDWRDVNIDKNNSPFANIDTNYSYEDLRFEGTPAYLPPEVLLNQVTGFDTSVDAWSLGCLTYFCLSGRPPFYGDAQQVINQMFEKKGKVTFLLDEINEDKEDDSIQMSRCAYKFIDSLMCIDVVNRLNFANVFNEDYLIRGYETMDCNYKLIDTKILEPKKLHFQNSILLPPLEIQGKASLNESQEWARRQLSVIWAPMPSDSNSCLEFNSDCVEDKNDIYNFDTIIETKTEKYKHFN